MIQKKKKDLRQRKEPAIGPPLRSLDDNVGWKNIIGWIDDDESTTERQPLLMIKKKVARLCSHDCSKVIYHTFTALTDHASKTNESIQVS